MNDAFLFIIIMCKFQKILGSIAWVININYYTFLRFPPNHSSLPILRFLQLFAFLVSYVQIIRILFFSPFSKTIVLYHYLSGEFPFRLLHIMFTSINLEVE